MPIAVRMPAQAGAPLPDPAPIKTNYAPRAVRLAVKDFERFGFTGGCPGCEYLATGLGGRKGHSTECRLRMEDLLSEDADGQLKLKNADERRQQWMTEQVENNADPASVQGTQAASEGGMNTEIGENRPATENADQG